MIRLLIRLKLKILIFSLDFTILPEKVMNKEEKIKEEKDASLKFKIRRFFSRGFLGNNIVRFSLLALLFLNAANWIVLTVFFAGNSQSFFSILHYNVYFGVDLVGEWWQAYSVPSIATFLVLLNVFLAWRFYEGKERVASYALLMASLMLQISSAIATASIILINY